MGAYISSLELAELVTGLLLKPELVGELDSPDHRSRFFEDVARVVASHCGGVIDGVVTVDPSGDDGTTGPQTRLSVSPDDALSSLEQNVWSMFAPAAWGADNGQSGHEGAAIPSVSCARRRATLRGLLAGQGVEDGKDSLIEANVRDWRIRDGEPVDQQGDEAPYTMQVWLGDQVSIDFLRDGEIVSTTFVEIDLGCPTVHLSAGGDPALHVRTVESRLVMTPDASDARPCRIDSPDRYCYHATNAMLLE